MTETSGYRQSIPLAAACVLAFLLPFPFPFGAAGVILVTATGVLLRGKTIFCNYPKRKLLWAWTALYLWHLCSWLWSTDKMQAGGDLSTKLSLLLLPFAVGSAGLYRREALQKVLLALTLGMATVAAYCLWAAWGRYRVDGDAGGLFYHRLVQGFDAHAIYMSWYTLIAILFLLLEPVRLRFFGSFAVRLLLLLLLLAFFFMLTARTLILFFVVVAMPVALWQAFRRKTALREKLLIFMAAGVVAGGAYMAFENPVINARFRELRKSDPRLSFLNHYNGEENDFSNLNVRLFLWRVGLENMGNLPVLLRGTGVGDAHLVINERIRQLGIPRMEKDAPERHPFYDINLHNTFLQIALMTGIPGLLLLLVAAVAPLGKALRRFRTFPLEGLFFGSALLLMLQEAILQTQAGVVFYLFLSCIFLDHASRREADKHT